MAAACAGALGSDAPIRGAPTAEGTCPEDFGAAPANATAAAIGAEAVDQALADAGALLAPRQAELLGALAAALGAEPGAAEAQASGFGLAGDSLAAVDDVAEAARAWPSKDLTYEMFFSFWFRTEASRKKAAEQASVWSWMTRFDEMCGEVCAELDRLLADVDNLERQRHEVVLKTANLQQLCGPMLGEQERVAAVADAISERLGVFEAAASIERRLDEEDALASLAGFAALLDQIEEAVAYLEGHYEFDGARECFQRLDNLRNRACILVRASLTKSLKRAEAQMESSLWDEGVDGTIDTQVFYRPFHAAAPNQKPLMSLLLQRAQVHKRFAAALEELESLFCAMRFRIIGDAAAEHLLVLRGTWPEPGQLATFVREAAGYLLETAKRERQLFASFFETRQPQEALETLIQQLGREFFTALQPAVVGCSNLDALRETAECLQGEFLEPNELVAERGGAAGAAFSPLLRLRADVREALALRAREAVEGGVRGFAPAPADLEPEALRRRRYPSLDSALAVLAETFRALPAEHFQPLAQEVVSACVVSLKTAADHIAARAIPMMSQDGLGWIARALDARLFLTRQLLVLREQLAALECDVRAAGGPPAPPPGAGACAALPACCQAAAASADAGGARRLRLQRGRMVEDELALVCQGLLDVAMAWIGGPQLFAHEAGAGAEGLPGVRERLGAVAVHVRGFFPEPSAASPVSPAIDESNAEPTKGRGDIADVLLDPLRDRLRSLLKRRCAGVDDTDIAAALAALSAEACRA